MSVIRGGFNIYQIIACVLSSLAVIFITLPIHEFAHGFAATKLGDPTPRFEGRLTLNPFAHIDYLGALCIILFGFGWAKPVGINPRYFKNPKWGMAISALAGPLSNIIVSIICIIFTNLLSLIAISSEAIMLVYSFFLFVAQINVYLAVFNLLPVPPLDGSRILFAVLPQKYYFKVMRYERYISLALIALLWLGVLSVPLNFISNYVLRFVYFIANLPFGFN